MISYSRIGRPKMISLPEESNIPWTLCEPMSACTDFGKLVDSPDSSVSMSSDSTDTPAHESNDERTGYMHPFIEEEGQLDANSHMLPTRMRSQDIDDRAIRPAIEITRLDTT